MRTVEVCYNLIKRPATDKLSGTTRKFIIVAVQRLVLIYSRQEQLADQEVD